LYSLWSPISTERPHYILYTINFEIGSETVEKRMAEIQKLKHLILVVIMPLLITNIAMAYNVSTDTTDITGNNRD
jgi:hypothetical protein